jgi:hypothetical protein
VGRYIIEIGEDAVMMMRRVVITAVAVAGLVGAGSWVSGAFAATGDPGTVADPLVTKSYVDEAVAQFVSKEYLDQTVARLVDKAYVDGLVAGMAQKTYVDSKVAGLADKAYVDAKVAAVGTGGTGGTGGIDAAYLENRLAQMKTSFEVVRVPKGSIILGESGTEMVLRGGKATAIVSAMGGVLDATAGVDLWPDAPVTPNHLLVIPVGDGRGLTAQADMILIVKGPYTVKSGGQ